MCRLFARYAELYPDEVDRIFMLCPSFGLGTRAQNFGSPTEMAEWERTGARGEENGRNVLVSSGAQGKRRSKQSARLLFRPPLTTVMALPPCQGPLRWYRVSSRAHVLPGGRGMHQVLLDTGISTERPSTFVPPNHSIPVVDRRGSKRPLGLRRRSEAANGLPGLPLPGGDRARPARRGCASRGDQVARGREVGLTKRGSTYSTITIEVPAKCILRIESYIPGRCALLHDIRFFVRFSGGS